jgi:hypothetical protein
MRAGALLRNRNSPGAPGAVTRGYDQAFRNTRVVDSKATTDLDRCITNLFEHLFARDFV